MKEKGGLSSSQEDYLKQIYVLAQRSEEVRVTDIAKLLEISKPSVNRAMNTLKEQGYIEHEHYGTIKLTKEGVAAGKNIHETYKTAYKFLTEFLGVSAAEAEEEAHLMEHAMSKATRKKLKNSCERKNRRLSEKNSDRCQKGLCDLRDRQSPFWHFYFCEALMINLIRQQLSGWLPEHHQAVCRNRL